MLQCFDWARLTKPPYFFRLREMRKRYVEVKAEMRALYAAGRALKAAHAEWPDNALEHAENIVSAFQKLDMHWPTEPAGGASCETTPPDPQPGSTEGS